MLNAQDHDVYLLANLCDIDNTEELKKNLKTEIKSRNRASSIVLNGDLTSAPVWTDKGKKQFDQLHDFLYSFDSLVEHVFILTGDRDWNDTQPQGYKSFKALEAALKDVINQEDLLNTKLLTVKGCPGPFDIAINRYIHLIAFQSQWWNHTYQRPEASDAICKYMTDTDIAEEFNDIVANNNNKNILVVGHHPIRSMGNYGGRYSLIENFKPFPIVGSFYNAYKSNIGNRYSIKNKRLKKYTYLLYNELYFKNSLIYASGHEHNQQIHSEINNVLINSGNLGKGSYSPKDHTTLFNSKRPGYIRIEYEISGSVKSSFIDLKNKERITQPLYKSSCQPGVVIEKIDENQSYIPCNMSERLPDPDYIPQQALVLPGKGYQSNFLKNLFLGKHHRVTWNTPVDVPYLKISQPSVDLSPTTESNSGKQTLTLKFKDENKNRYTFRSIDKDTRKALNYELRKSIIGRIFEDQTSAQHPFGALPAARMLDHLDILHTDPKLYVLPDSKALGPFQKKYGGMLGMLEENPGKKNQNGVYFANADKIIKSNELFNELCIDLDYKVHTSEFLRARLFDILIGDWNRNKDNWKWAEYKSDKTRIYRPIPRNRDKAFSKWDGLLPWFADREWGLPNTEGFDYDIDGFQSAVFQAKHLDRFLLTEAEWSDYVDQVEWIKKELTDDRIVEAVKTMPQESFALEGEKIISKLIYRRDHLLDHALKFYKWLNEDVVILGSAKDDYFEIYEQKDSLVVEIWNEKNTERGTKRKFRRSFKDADTKRLRIYGLGEEDIYHVKLTKKPKIDLFLLGGEQMDIYRIEEAQNFLKVIDDKKNIDTLTANKIELSDNWHRKRYIYKRNGLKFNSYFPIVYVGYNQFFGTTLSVSNTWTRERWDKPDYHQRHKIRFNISAMGDFGLKYSGLSRHSLRKWDYMWEVTIANPDFFDSYYGQGNFSQIDPLLDQQDFYLIAYSNYNSLLGLRRKFWRRSTFSVQSGYDFFQSKRLENTILAAETSLLGANEKLGMLPIKTGLDLDFRDDQYFPIRGNRLILDIYQGWITNREWEGFTTIAGSIEQYMSSYNSRPFTLGLKIGGSKGIGEVPFYLQPRLGGNNMLRGYTSNRFFGRSSVYFNSELRWRIFKNDNASIPYEFGISTFYDIGKVSNQDTDLNLGLKWHQGYGGGVFFTPFDERFTMSLYLTWSEENSFYPRFTFGSALN